MSPGTIGLVMFASMLLLMAVRVPIAVYSGRITSSPCALRAAMITRTGPQAFAISSRYCSGRSRPSLSTARLITWKVTSSPSTVIISATPGRAPRSPVPPAARLATAWPPPARGYRGGAGGGTGFPPGVSLATI